MIKKRVFWWIIIVIAVIVFLFFGTKLGLWVNFLLGNDVIITLEENKEVFNLKNGEDAQAEFQVKITTNPFCTAVCDSQFKDLSRDKLIEKDSFTLRTGISHTNTFTINPQNLGEGTEFYQYYVSCKGLASAWCHSKEEETSRTFLVTANHELNDGEVVLKETLKAKTEKALLQLKIVTQTYDYIAQIAFNNTGTLKFGNYELLRSEINSQLSSTEKAWQGVFLAWSEQNYELLAQRENEFEGKINFLSSKLNQLNQSLNVEAQRYNLVILNAKEDIFQLQQLANETLILNSFLSAKVNSSIGKVNELTAKLSLPQGIIEAELLGPEITAQVEQLSASKHKELLRHALLLDLEQDLLCAISKICVEHPSLAIREVQMNFSVNESCMQNDDFSRVLDAHLIQLKQTIKNSNSSGLEHEAKIKFEAYRTGLLQSYLSSLNKKKALKNNTLLMKEILSEEMPLNSSGSLEEFNSSLKLYLVEQLKLKMLPACVIGNNTIINKLSATEISWNPPAVVPSESVLLNQTPKCCLWGECSVCNSSAPRYPIIFLHGHAFNSGTSADYSLDAFNQIQEKLESEGYVSAGSSAVYDHNAGELSWANIPKPITLKVSYYYDFMQESDKVSLVQTKSEPIDAYAIKLKEAIDWVQLKTAQPKVILVAHSMGGLVARRYVQIFGAENVDKMILIGAPNKGIVGNIASFCSIIGGELECRDMQQGSLFLNKLNLKKDAVPVYTINGKGCAMDGQDSDGVVLTKNAVLDWGDNTWIYGSCSGTEELLHTEMLNIEKYSEVYDKVVEVVGG